MHLIPFPFDDDDDGSTRTHSFLANCGTLIVRIVSGSNLNVMRRNKFNSKVGLRFHPTFARAK